jgi:hypothetical protein
MKMIVGKDVDGNCVKLYVNMFNELICHKELFVYETCIIENVIIIYEIN